MNKMTLATRSLADCTQGSNLLEYALAMILVAVACIGVVKAFGTSVKGLFSGATSALPTIGGAPAAGGQ